MLLPNLRASLIWPRAAQTNTKNKFFKAKSMNKEEIKEFHEFTKKYDRWQKHKQYQAKKHELHNAEESDTNIEDEPMKDDEFNYEDEMNAIDADLEDMQSIINDEEMDAWESLEQYAHE